MSNPLLPEILKQNGSAFGPVVPQNLNAPNVCHLDFTAQNPLLVNQDLKDTTAFDALVQQLLAEQKATVGIGGYLENRVIYRRSEHFSEVESKRSVHLGIDIWTTAFTPVMAPLDGRVHSFRDNNNFGDYGPTIILEHVLDGAIFYTLYGHLTRSSLKGLYSGKEINKGAEFAQIGPYPENGDWPPHLHFQVMADLMGMEGDFPGVCTLNQQERLGKICPDPNLLLQCQLLL